jgi:hypothetical protein
MKYVKQYEEYLGSNKDRIHPKKGDYVLLRFPRSYGYPQEFFDTHIGQIIKKGKGFSDYTIKFNTEQYDVLNLIAATYMRKWSDNREDLESIIATNKFNI